MGSRTSSPIFRIFEKSRTLRLMNLLSVRVSDFFGDTRSLVTKFKRFGTSRIVTLPFYCHQSLEMHSTLFLRRNLGATVARRQKSSFDRGKKESSKPAANEIGFTKGAQSHKHTRLQVRAAVACLVDCEAMFVLLDKGVRKLHVWTTFPSRATVACSAGSN